MDAFNVFILFPNETSVTDAVTDEATYRAYLNTIKDLIDRVDCEKGVNLWYDDLEKKIFINALTLLAESGEFYMLDPNLVVNELLRNAIDWTSGEQQQQETEFYALWDFNSLSVVQQIPPSVKEAFEYQMSLEKEKQLLLNLGTPFYPYKKELFVFKDKSSHDNQVFPIFIKLEQVRNFKDLEAWLMQNRTPRQLNTTDQRHNENSAFYIRGKSPILYDLSRDIQAKAFVQRLLDTAITDQYECKDLMNYDATKERYIWFEYENDNPQNQYHAYHLAKPVTHETNLTAIANIPKRAKRFIDKR